MQAKLKIILTLFMLSFSGVLYAQIDDNTDTDDALLEDTLSLSRSTSSIGLGRYRLGDGITFISKTDSYKISLSGFVQTNFEMTNYQKIDPLFEPIYDNTYTRFRVRRARIRLNGQAWGGKVRYRIGVDMVKGSETADEGSGATLSDAFVQWRPYNSNKLVITMGQRYTPTDNKEAYMSSLTSEFAEKSKLSSAFATNREVGFFFESSMKIGQNQYIRPSLAITDGNGPISSSTRFSGVKVGGRVNYLPLGTFRMMGETRFGDMVYELTPKVAIGVAYSYASRTADRRGGDGGGPYVYKTMEANTATPVAQSNMTMPNYSKMSADIMFKYKGVTIFGEYIKSWAKVPDDIYYRVVFNSGTTNPPSLSTSFNQSLDMNGENGDINAYVRNRMILGSGYNIQGSYMFRSLWNVGLRYTHIEPDKFSYLNNKSTYDRNDWYACSVTRWLTNSYAAKIQMTYALTKPDNGFGRVAQSADAIKFTGYEHHLWVMFQLAF